MEATDRLGALVRVVLFDYQKAFDFVDHTPTIIDKLKSLDILSFTINWIADLLTNKQRVELGEDCFSE